jgi:ketosteroid isomerase-like protein
VSVRRSRSNSPRERAVSYFEAVNAGRWDDVVSHFHSDAVLEIPAQRPKLGHGEIRRFYESVPRQFPVHHDEPVVLLANGDDVMASIDFRGRRPNGDEVQFWAADCFRFEQGRIRLLRITFDPGVVRW